MCCGCLAMFPLTFRSKMMTSLAATGCCDIVTCTCMLGVEKNNDIYDVYARNVRSRYGRMTDLNDQASILLQIERNRVPLSCAASNTSSPLHSLAYYSNLGWNTYFQGRSNHFLKKKLPAHTCTSVWLYPRSSASLRRNWAMLQTRILRVG